MEQFLAIIVGSVLSPLVDKVAGRYGMSHSTVVFLFGLLLGVAYGLYTLFVPEAAKEHILTFAMSVVGTAVLAHEKYWKIKKK